MKGYWLFKSEAGEYPIGWLKRVKRATWDGVRNYQARNYLRDRARPGDGVLFYHSSCPQPGVAGLAEVVGPPRPDPSQFDVRSPHYDPRATPGKPIWYVVDLRFRREARRLIPASLLRQVAGLEDLPLFRQSRLSVMPVTPAQWRAILSLKGFW